MDDLNTFADKFNQWRGDKRYYRYPKHFWDEIRYLAKDYPIHTISKALSINLPYLKKKLLKDVKPVAFASLKITSLQAPVSIEFLDRHSRTIIVRLQANPIETAQLILSLSGGE